MLAELRESSGQNIVWLEGRCSSYGGEASARTIRRGASRMARARSRETLRSRHGRGSAHGSRRWTGPIAVLEMLPLLGDVLGLRVGTERARAILVVAGRTCSRSARCLRRAGSRRSPRPGRSSWGSTICINADRSSMMLAEALLELTDRGAFVLAATLRPESDSARVGVPDPRAGRVPPSDRRGDARTTVRRGLSRDRSRARSGRPVDRGSASGAGLSAPRGTRCSSGSCSAP